MITGRLFIQNNDKEVHVVSNLIVDSGWALLPKKINLEDQGGSGAVGELDIRLGSSTQPTAPTDIAVITPISEASWNDKTKLQGLGSDFIGPHTFEFAVLGQLTSGVKKNYKDLNVASVFINEVVLWDSNAGEALARVVIPRISQYLGDNLVFAWAWFWDFDPERDGYVEFIRTVLRDEY